MVAAEEIEVKVAAALSYRLAVSERMSAEREVASAARHFDRRVFETMKADPQALTPQRTTLTIAFWDIRGFSALSEALKEHPTSVTDFLAEYFDLAVDAVFAHNGILDKFIGDGVMALFGVLPPDGSTQGARDAVDAAVTLRLRFEELLIKWTREWSRLTAQKISIGLGAGLHTGDAIVGSFGTSQRDQFTALGSAVNLAQRIESRASRSQILVSNPVRVRCEDVYRFVPLDAISDLKNVAGTFEVFEVA
jgi:adenylate cyclase